jgi:hypothetical protein
MVFCKVCGRECANYLGLSSHLRTHKITSKEYYDRFLKKEGEGICPVCGKETSFINLREGYHKFCSNKCANSKENHSMFGKHHSKEAREKISNAMKGENNPNYGKHPSRETRKKMSNTHKGKRCPEETKKKISSANRGKRCSEETKKNMSEAKKGENHPNYGKHLTEGTKKKISDANKGKHHTEETKKKISNALKGENNPNYKDGNSLKEFKDAYGLEPSEWQKLAQEIRKRDNFTCQLCGKKGATDVHHIIPRRIKIDNSPDNLITLCRSCHGKVEHLTDIYLANGKDPREIFVNKKFQAL